MDDLDAEAEWETLVDDLRYISARLNYLQSEPEVSARLTEIGDAQPRDLTAFLVDVERRSQQLQFDWQRKEKNENIAAAKIEFSAAAQIVE